MDRLGKCDMYSGTPQIVQKSATCTLGSPRDPLSQSGELKLSITPSSRGEAWAEFGE